MNDRTTTSRQQLRVYVVREADLRNLPEVGALGLVLKVQGFRGLGRLTAQG